MIKLGWGVSVNLGISQSSLLRWAEFARVTAENEANEAAAAAAAAAEAEAEAKADETYEPFGHTSADADPKPEAKPAK